MIRLIIPRKTRGWRMPTFTPHGDQRLKPEEESSRAYLLTKIPSFRFLTSTKDTAEPDFFLNPMDTCSFFNTALP